MVKGVSAVSQTPRQVGRRTGEGEGGIITSGEEEDEAREPSDSS